MSSTSKIEWLDGGSTWNPVTGCTPISEGCVNCYAKKMAETRLRGRYGYDEDEPFKITYHPDKLEQPLQWKKPRMIFVCSMGDLFHNDVENEYIDKVFSVMEKASQHTFLILTKRVVSMWVYLTKYGNNIPKNIWVGTTTESDQHGKRLDMLMEIPAHIRFLSIEPLLSPITFINNYPEWIICGAETGVNARPMDINWARNLRDQCKKNGVPFFFKKAGNRKETPKDLQVREYPRGF